MSLICGLLSVGGSNRSHFHRSIIGPGSKLIEFYEVNDASSREFEAAMKIYVSSFRENERRPIASIVSMLSNGTSRLIVGEEADEIVFMALLYPIKGMPFLLGDYLATSESHRNRGIGKAFVRLVLDETVFDETGNSLRPVPFEYFLVQIEYPHDGIDDLANRRRVFYRRLGMKELKGVKYILPPLQGDRTTDLALMLSSRDDEHFLDGRVVRDLVTRMFKELYNRHESDDLLARTLETIPDQVRLD